MKDAPIPPTDDARLEYLRSLDLLATPAEADFDRIIEIAAEHFKSPIALLSLVDKDRQWFKSRSGLNAAETPRNISFCGHAIA